MENIHYLCGYEQDPETEESDDVLLGCDVS